MLWIGIPVVASLIMFTFLFLTARNVYLKSKESKARAIEALEKHEKSSIRVEDRVVTTKEDSIQSARDRFLSREEQDAALDDAELDKNRLLDKKETGSEIEVTDEDKERMMKAANPLYRPAKKEKSEREAIDPEDLMIAPEKKAKE